MGLLGGQKSKSTKVAEKIRAKNLIKIRYLAQKRLAATEA
jgi:hypothetical protein